MRTGLIGKKIGCSSFFHEKGKVVPITLVKVDECIVCGVKTIEKNGYNAIQLISKEKNSSSKKINKPQKKLFSNIKLEKKGFLKEFRIDQNNFLEVGTKINASHFKKGQIVDVTGTSIGKGFAGSMKRHNFGGGRASHGVSVSHRAHGSTGHSQDPGRVFKGKKMAGHMGAKTVTKQNLEIMDIDEKNKIILIKGSIPGKKNSVILIKDAIKKKQN
tara:strand:- start:2797 stop:3444 length:648 start_codon:yes stop_codon:yes gene_type:complete